MAATSRGPSGERPTCSLRRRRSSEIPLSAASAAWYPPFARASASEFFSFLMSPAVASKQIVCALRASATRVAVLTAVRTNSAAAAACGFVSKGRFTVSDPRIGTGNCFPSPPASATTTHATFASGREERNWPSLKSNESRGSGGTLNPASLARTVTCPADFCSDPSPLTRRTDSGPSTVPSFIAR